jgi:hypothetical protein
MQTITGISSGKNNKSCGIIQNEPNKIGFAFFRFIYNLLRNLQETAKALLLFELPFCREALEKKFGFAMWPLGDRPEAVRPNSGQPPAGAGRARVGEGPWVLGDRFPCSVAAGKGPAGWASAARRSGRRCLLYQRGGALWVGWARLRARLGAREGGEQLVLVRNRPELVARRGGSDGEHGGERGGAGAIQRGCDPFMAAYAIACD